MRTETEDPDRGAKKPGGKTLKVSEFLEIMGRLSAKDKRMIIQKFQALQAEAAQGLDASFSRPQGA